MRSFVWRSGWNNVVSGLVGSLGQRIGGDRVELLSRVELSRWSSPGWSSPALQGGALRVELSGWSSPGWSSPGGALQGGALWVELSRVLLSRYMPQVVELSRVMVRSNDRTE